MNLQDVTQFRVSQQIVTKTEDTLRRAGSEGFEMMILWSGVYDAWGFVVKTPHAPRQTSYQLAEGLCVRVDGEELHRLNVRLHDSSEVLAAQIHTHPSEAYHSDTDDSYPIATALGAVSIVVPDFARRGVFTSDTAFYRLTEGGWRRLSATESHELVKVEG